MNIQNSTATLASSAPATTTGRTGIVGTGHIVPDAGDGVDRPADGAPSAPGFGSMLTKHLDDAAADAADGAMPRAATDTTPTAVDPATTGVNAVVPQALYPTCGTPTTPASGSADGAQRKSRSEDDHAVDGSAGSDLAAQLALASQWTGVARPVDAATAPTSAPTTTSATAPTSALATPRAAATVPVAVAMAGGEAPGPDDVETAVGNGGVAPKDAAFGGRERVASNVAPVDATTGPTAAAAPIAPAIMGGVAPAVGGVKAAVGKERPSSKDDAIGASALAASFAATSTPVATTPVGTANDDARRDSRGTPADAASMPTKDDAKTRDALAVAALDAASAAVAGTPVPAQATLDGDAFALRLATHVSNVQTPVATPTAAAASTPPTAFLREPVGSPAWSHEVGQAALRMAADDLQSASIRLNPEHLGPLDVQVRVDNGVAHLAFTATHADTRQALEASRGTLDQLFTSQGLKMGDVSVGAGSSGSANDAFAARGDQATGGSRRDGGRWSNDGAGTDGDTLTTTVTTRIARALGLVDTFA